MSVAFNSDQSELMTVYLKWWERSNRTDTVHSAVSKARELLFSSDLDSLDEEIHSVKSVLYAAIENVRMETERNVSLQMMLRELFSLISRSADISDHERITAIQLIQDLNDRYCN